jgi:hypothetical protein
MMDAPYRFSDGRCTRRAGRQAGAQLLERGVVGHMVVHPFTTASHTKFLIADQGNGAARRNLVMRF